MVALVLASRSAARRALLSQAGVAYDAVDAGVDEDAIKADFTGSPATLAVELAKAKALAVSNKRPGVVILGLTRPWISRANGSPRLPVWKRPGSVFTPWPAAPIVCTPAWPWRGTER